MVTTSLLLKPYTMKSGVKLGLTSPYHPTLPAKAKALGGSWSANDARWYFDPRDVERVRALCLDVYGIDPLAETPAELVTVQIRLADWMRAGRTGWDQFSVTDAWFAGRQILHYTRPGDGCAIVAGKLTNGGSRRHPEANGGRDAILEVRDVPVGALRAEQEQHQARIDKRAELIKSWLAQDDSNPEGSGYNATYWSNLTPEQRTEALAPKRDKWRQELAELEAQRDAITVVSTLNPSAVIHEVAAALPPPEPKPGELPPTERLWQEIQQLSPQERAGLLGRLLRDN